MVTEDYVSFEIAKLLEEKGFDEYCMYFYTLKDEGREGYKSNRTLGEFAHNSHPDLKGRAVSCPTLQMAMKWLREVHHLCIFLIPSYVDQNFHYDYALYPECNGEWEWCASKNDGSKAIFGYNVNNKYCKTYEEATNALIKYCLENLI